MTIGSTGDGAALGDSLEVLAFSSIVALILAERACWAKNSRKAKGRDRAKGLEASVVAAGNEGQK